MTKLMNIRSLCCLGVIFLILSVWFLTRKLLINEIRPILYNISRSSQEIGQNTENDLQINYKQNKLWEKINPLTIENKLQMLREFVSSQSFIVSDEYAERYFVEGEEELLAEAAVTDTGSLPSSFYSKASLSRSAYNQNDIIEVFIELFDGYNRRMTRGGDDIRIWLTGHRGFKTGAEVFDFKNGTYIARSKSFRHGKVTIHTSITYSAEEIRALLRSRRLSKVLRYSVGIFKQGYISDVTLCSPFKNIPVFNHVCNLTSLNQNKYYCGKPNSTKLKCTDLYQIQTINYNRQLMTELEERLLSRGQRMNKLKTMDIMINKDIPVKLPNCSSFNKSLTWTNRNPQGYFYDKQWYPAFCIGRVDSTRISKCIKDLRITMIGDSTVQQMFYSLIELTKCESVKWMGVGYSLNRNRYCDIQNSNFRVSFGIHGLPYSMVKGDNVSFTKSIQSRLEEIPIEEDVSQIVFIHLYAHFLYFHTSVFVSRVQSLKDSLIKLFSRNSKVKVFIKGPHSFIKENDKPIVKSDYFGNVYTKIIKRELFELRHHIWYLDYWDMSVSAENNQLHPGKGFVDEMVKLFMNLACP